MCLLSKKNSFQEIMLSIPNIPLDDVPEGKTDKDNEVIKFVGEPKKFDFDISDHVDLGKNLDILDFEVGAKIAGKRFAFMKGFGAKLERAIFTFIRAGIIDFTISQVAAFLFLYYI